jgi:PAS domain S-box-containing protein
MLSAPPELAQSVLEAAPDAMVVIDAGGHIRCINRQVSALFGYSRGEIVGGTVELLIPGRFHNRHVGHRIQYGENQPVRPMGAGLKLFGRHRDGTEFPVEISLSPIQDCGEVFTVAAIRNVTDRKRVEAELGAQLEEMQRLHDVTTHLIEATDLSNILEGILHATIALQQADFGNIQLCDPTSGVLKIAAQRGFSENFLEHFATVDQRDVSCCGRVLQLGERVVIEDVEKDPAYAPHRLVAMREGYRALQSTPIRGRDGTITGMISTHFRRPHRPSDRELQLTDIYMRLVSVLIGRVQDEEALREARDLADRANQAKSRFLATASHDLRQPLQTLSMLNKTLSSLIKEPRARDAIEHERKTLSAMSRLLNALLDISKLESGAVRPEPTDFAVANLLEELRREFLDLATDKGLTLEVEPSADRVYSDPNLVGELLRNLVSNAIKYTLSGWVRLRSLREAAGVRIEVLDTGIGIASDQIPLIFDEFYQVAGPTNNTHKGYGLGLSIVQRIARLLEIKLDVRSAPGRGSMFSVVLPAGKASSEALAPTSLEQAGSGLPRSGRVLLVEDEPSVREATQLLLTVEGYDVETAGSLTEAVELAGRQAFDLLITDYHLPGGHSGQDVIKAVRLTQGWAMPALLVTGDTSSFIQSLNQDSRLQIVRKPVNADEMLRLLDDLRSPANSP